MPTSVRLCSRPGPVPHTIARAITVKYAVMYQSCGARFRARRASHAPAPPMLCCAPLVTSVPFAFEIAFEIALATAGS